MIWFFFFYPSCSVFFSFSIILSHVHHPPMPFTSLMEPCYICINATESSPFITQTMTSLPCYPVMTPKCPSISPTYPLATARSRPANEVQGCQRWPKPLCCHPDSQPIRRLPRYPRYPGTFPSLWSLASHHTVIRTHSLLPFSSFIYLPTFCSTLISAFKWPHFSRTT